MEELTTLLESLASKLGTTTEYLWGVLIKQAPIESITHLILFGVALLLIIPYVRYIKWFSKVKDDLYDSDQDILHWIIIGGIGLTLCIGVILGACEVSNIITGFINPEYWALEQILNKI